MSARVGWLVKELEEENSSMQDELKTLQEERDLLRNEVDEQRMLLKNCVEEVFSLKEELNQLVSQRKAAGAPPAEAQRQQRLCERLTRHVTDIEREVAERGARAAEWRAERERRDAERKELQATLERLQSEQRTLSAELDQTRQRADLQARERTERIRHLEETVQVMTKKEAVLQSTHTKQLEQLKEKLVTSEKSAKSLGLSQQQLSAARRDQERLSQQLAVVRQRLREREGQLTEASSQLTESRRKAEIKIAQVTGLKSALQESKASSSRLVKDLDKIMKQEETQSKTIVKKDGIIQKQRTKLEEVAKDLNKLKTVFSEQDLPGLCVCTPTAGGGSLRDLRVLVGGRPGPPCAAKQLRIVADNLKRKLASAQARIHELETSLDEIRKKLPQMSAEADRAYIELQTRLKDAQTEMEKSQTAQQQQQKRNHALLLKMATAGRRLRDQEQLALRLRQENKCLITDRVQWERTSAKLQAALHETVQLTARLQAARAELEAERKLTTLMRHKLDQAEVQLNSQLGSVVEGLQQLKQTPAASVDWPSKYEALLDRCHQWQEECLARQKDCHIMEQRLVSQQDKKASNAGKTSEAQSEQHWPDESQLRRLEEQLKALLAALGSAPEPALDAARARSVPQVVAPSAAVWHTAAAGAADTSSGSLRSTEGIGRAAIRSADTHSPLPSPRCASATSRSPVVTARTPAQAAAGPDTGRTADSVTLPELAPLLSRVVQAVDQVEQQRHQLNTQGRLLEQYRRSAAGGGLPPQQQQQHAAAAVWAAALQREQLLQAAEAQILQEVDAMEPPCRESDSVMTGRGSEAGGDDVRRGRVGQTQSASDGRPPSAVVAARRQRDSSRSSSRHRHERQQLERLAHFKNLQELVSKMTAPAAASATTAAAQQDRGRTGRPPAVTPDLAELRAQWRRLETMVRDEADSLRSRSDVVLRLSGISESSPASDVTQS